MTTIVALIGGRARRLMLPAFGALAVAAVIAAAIFATASENSGGVAEAQALPPPSNQQARNTAAPGEVIVTWNAAAGASAYRIGWLNHQDYLAAGSAWLQRFTFADVPSSVLQYRVTRLTPGEEYWFIVASVDANNRMYWPQSWIQKFAVTAAPTPTPCPTTHGPGAPTGGGDGAMCPITGLPIGDGYLEIGGVSAWGEYSIRLDSATVPATVDFTNGSREAPAGRKWISLELTAQNDRNYSVFFGPGTEYVLDTDAGNGFAWQSRDELEANRGYTITLVHDIPATATVAVLAVQADTGYTDSAYNQPDLFRIPIPQ